MSKKDQTINTIELLLTIVRLLINIKSNSENFHKLF